MTYNQSETIIKALESVRSQDYPNIEIIVTDDFSTDDTVEKVRNWLRVNDNHFVRAEVIVNYANTGICFNISQGISEARGTWVKPLAGDDYLESIAISEYVKFANNTGAQLVFSQMIMFSEDQQGSQELGKFLTNTRKIKKFSNQDELRKEVLYQNFLPAPASFFSLSAFQKAGGIDFRFKHLDDWPLWVNMLEIQTKTCWFPRPLVNYRISSLSVSQNNLAMPVAPRLFEDIILFYSLYQRKSLKGLMRWDRFLFIIRAKVTNRIDEKNINIRKMVSFIQVLSPLFWLKVISWVKMSFSKEDKYLSFQD